MDANKVSKLRAPLPRLPLRFHPPSHMTQDRHARGIGYYLTALILLAVVPLLIITGVLVWRQSAVQRQAFERSMLQTALALSVAVDRQLESYRVMLETLSESDSLRRGDIDTFYGFAKRAADHNGALFISLFDRDGQSSTRCAPRANRCRRRSRIRA